MAQYATQIWTFLAAIALLCVPTHVLAEDYGSATVQRVTSIYDGDTFRADIEGWPRIIGERVPIRLRGADTPEIRGECQAEKDAARRAKQFTVAKLRGAHTIRLDHIDRGKYFRIVADVTVDGRNLAQMLIAETFARPYSGGHRQGWCSR